MPLEFSKNSRIAAFVCAVTAIALIWGVLLPSIAARPEFETARLRFEECGVNASALFYSDHPRTYDARFSSHGTNQE